MFVKLVADNFICIGRVVEDGTVLLRVGRERRRQLFGRDSVPLGAELVTQLVKRK